MDKLFSKSEPVHTPETQRSFEEKIWDLVNLQLEYIEKVDTGALAPLSGEKMAFSKMLMKYSFIRFEIDEQYHRRVPAEMKNNEAAYNQFQADVISKIEAVYQTDKTHWKEKVRDTIRTAANPLGLLREKDKTKQESEDFTAGLADFNPSSWEESEQVGIPKNSELLNIHFRPLAEQKENDDNVQNIFSKDSLSKIAVEIVEKQPFVKGVLGRSWIVSSPIGKRIGFSVVRIDNEVSDAQDFWGQFIDEYGNINKERAKKFMETGKPEFPIAVGIIPVEDFLKKYLPEDKKGKVLLQDISPAFNEFDSAIKETIKKIFNYDLSLTPDDVLQILNENNYLKEFLATDDGKQFIKLTQKAVAEKGYLGDADMEGRDEIIKSFHDHFKYITDNKYIAKEVII